MDGIQGKVEFIHKAQDEKEYLRHCLQRVSQLS
uniref:Uncharacterized protein n=1 Tax=Arundo donax TaxID=35708 RepID=A0A0A9GN08_ARUDO